MSVYTAHQNKNNRQRQQHTRWWTFITIILNATLRQCQEDMEIASDYIAQLNTSCKYRTCTHTKKNLKRKLKTMLKTDIIIAFTRGMKSKKNINGRKYTQGLCIRKYASHPTTVYWFIRPKENQSEFNLCKLRFE